MKKKMKHLIMKMTALHLPIDDGESETGDDAEYSDNGYDETRDNNCDEDTVDITTRSDRTCRT